MERVHFYHFSGTGNTLLVMQAMSDVFRENGVEVEQIAIKAGEIPVIPPGIAIGLAVPVAMQGTYPFIWQWLTSLPKAQDNQVFLVDTLLEFSGGIIGPIGKILRHKGYQTIGAREIRMPANIFRFNINENKDEIFRKNGIQKAKRFASQLLEGKTRWGRIPVLSDILSRFSRGRFWWSMYRVVKIRLNKEACTKCGICVGLCPVDTISMNEYPEFKNNCEMCMRCVSYCPANALSLGRYKKQYKAVNLSQIKDS